LFYSDSKDSTHCIAEVAREAVPNMDLVSFGPSHTVDQTSRVIMWGLRSTNHIASIAKEGDLIIHMGFENHRLGAIPSQEQEIERNIKNTYDEYAELGVSKADILILGYVYEKNQLPKGFKVMIGSEPHNMRVLLFKGVGVRSILNLSGTAHAPMEPGKCFPLVAKYTVLANYARNLAFHVLDFHLLLKAFRLKPVIYYKRLPNYVGYSKGLLLIDPTYDMPSDILALYTQQYEIEFARNHVVAKAPVPPSTGGRGGRAPVGARNQNKPARGGGRGKGGDALSNAFGNIKPVAKKSEKEIASSTKLL